MSKLKLFLSNILIYGFGGVISKAVPLIMVPIVTRIMPDSTYFGLNDETNTLISIAHAVAVMGMYDALYRLFFDKNEPMFRKSVCSTAFGFTFALSVIVSAALLLLCRPLAAIFYKDQQYTYLVFICAATCLTSSTNSILAAPTRMQNKRGIYLTINSLTPVLTYSVAIVFLLNGYYTIAIPLAALVSGLVAEIVYAVLNRSWFSFRSIDWSLLKPLLVIGAPLFPIFLVYWVFHSCDKLMITSILGLGEEGIYAVGSKLGQMSQLVYTAFAGGWQFFAFSTMNEKNQVKNNSMVFEYLGAISFVVTMFVCAWANPLFKILFTEEYLPGYIVAPYLFFSPLLLMLYQVVGNQFLVIKKTWPGLLILSCGALMNIGLNSILIPLMGIEGAAIATLAGYVVSLIICVIVLQKMRLVVVTRRFLISSGLMAVYFLIWRFLFPANTWIGSGIAMCGTLIILSLYRADIKQLISMVSTEIAKKRGKKNDIAE